MVEYEECRCFVCGNSSQHQQVKVFRSQTIASFLIDAASRRSMKTDKYKVITQKANLETLSLAGYHSSCYRIYTATKCIQNPSPADEEEPVSKKVTRSVSKLPRSDQQGLLKGACIFYGLSRKKLKGREEQLYKISTLEGSRSLKNQVPFSGNERIKSLMRSGVDLIAKEAEYHKTCRVQFETKPSKH